MRIVQALQTVAPLMLAALASSPCLAQQDAWPSRTVTVIVPFTPGTVVDLETRLYTQKLSENTGRNFVVDYRTGAGAMIGAGHVVKSAPDGYTLLAATSGLTIAPLIFKNLGFDPIKDLAYVTIMSKRAPMLIASLKFPPNNGAEYIAYARANPGKINFGTSGATGAGHLSMQVLHQLTGTKATFVHYKGGAATFAAVTTGELDVVIGSVIGAMPLVKSGKVKVLGIMSAQRVPQFPDMPAIAESTVPGWEYAPWQAYAAPAKTPAAVLDRINAEFVKVAKDPALGEKLAGDATIMMGTTRQEVTQFVTAEAARWRKVVADIGLKFEE
jgi:tripartite-type tricarboxylate transporter receptor subunit TctC